MVPRLRDSHFTQPRDHFLPDPCIKTNAFAEIHAVDVLGSDSMSTVEYHLIVKSHPQNEDAQRFLQPGHTFDKEVGMYGQVRRTVR